MKANKYLLYLLCVLLVISGAYASVSLYRVQTTTIDTSLVHVIYGYAFYEKENESEWSDPLPVTMPKPPSLLEIIYQIWITILRWILFLPGLLGMLFIPIFNNPEK